MSRQLVDNKIDVEDWDIISDNEPGASKKGELKTIGITEDKLTLINIKTPDNIGRQPVNICAVIDVSGSMNQVSTIKTEQGEECHGLTKLDLVKHSLKTIIHSLNDYDVLSLVTFCDKAVIELDQTVMNSLGKKVALGVVNKLNADASTNLWDGLKKGLDLLKESRVNNTYIFLLTDGEPNVHPVKGYHNVLKIEMDVYEQQGKIFPTINNFGFGYQLDSKLLNELSTYGNGTYAFIPDASFVGTVFINALSNAFSAYASDAYLTIKLNNAKIDDNNDILLSCYNYLLTEILTVDIGLLLQGQNKNILLPISFADKINEIDITLNYFNLLTNSNESILIKLNNNKIEDITKAQFEFITCITELNKLAYVNNTKDIGEKLNMLIKQLTEVYTVNKTPYMHDLLKDLTDQVSEALLKSEYYNKWGKHYLPSLIRAHLMQQCNNFKDPGVQHYGGLLFNSLRDELDKVFSVLPAPKPSVQGYKEVASMSYYNSASNPCFDASCTVLMSDMKIKRVDELVKGDMIMNPDKKSGSKILCIIRTICKDGKVFYVKFSNGLLITPYHPIKINNKWIFPKDVNNEENVYEYNAKYVYSFVLDSGHIMTINGVECITLGHNFQEDVTKHAYFGTNKVIEELKTMGGYNEGLVDLTSDNIKRDPITGLFQTIAYKPAITQ